MLIQILNTRTNELIDLAIVYKGYRPVLIETDDYNDIDSLVMFLEQSEKDFIIKDDLNIRPFDNDEFLAFLSIENEKNSIEGFSLFNDDIESYPGTKIEKHSHYVDDSNYIWIRKGYYSYI